MKPTRVIGSRRQDRAAARAGASATFPPTEPEVPSGEAEQGGTPDDVLSLDSDGGVRRVVTRLALALLALERVVPEGTLEAWGDNVRPAIDLLFRFGGKR